MAGQLSLQVDCFLSHFAGSSDRASVGLAATLRQNKQSKRGGDLHVRGLEGATAYGAAAADYLFVLRAAAHNP